MLEGSGMDQFYLTLPSSSSYDYYGVQPPCKYRTRLSREICLDPSAWEVGLCELTYSQTWFNVVDVEIRIWHAVKMKWALCKVPDGRYLSPSELTNACTKAMASKCRRAGIEPESLSMHTTLGKRPRCVLSVAQDVVVELNSNAALLLGFGECKKFVACGSKPPHRVDGEKVHDESTGTVVAHGPRALSPFPVDTTRLFNTLYVYSDLVEPQLVGDAFVPLVRAVVHRDGDRERTETVSRAFTNIHYLRLSRGHFQETLVNITNDAGRDLPFEGGRVTVKLHFRKRRS